MGTFSQTGAPILGIKSTEVEESRYVEHFERHEERRNTYNLPSMKKQPCEACTIGMGFLNAK